MSSLGTAELTQDGAQLLEADKAFSTAGGDVVHELN